jgi:Mor family transcriptional regulator
MKYRNASDVLPDELLREVQKYASGDTLYVPGRGERAKWGQGSGARAFYESRNEAIRNGFRSGRSVEGLADAYCLSEERIRKIVYGSPSGPEPEAGAK